MRPARRMPVGPLRDLLALLVQATRGGTYVRLSILCARTGVPPAVMQQRVEALVGMGYAEERWLGGLQEWRGTQAAQEALGPTSP